MSMSGSLGNSGSIDLKKYSVTSSQSSIDELGREVLVLVGETNQKVPAIIRYRGDLHISSGIWVGVELFSPTGKNDGCVQGKRYFTCPPNYGLFVRPNRLVKTTVDDIKAFHKPKSIDDTEGNEEDDQFDIASLPNNFAHRPASSKPALNKNNSYASGVSGGGLLNPIPTITTQIKPFEVRVPTGELRRSPSTETRKTPSMDRESHVEEEEPMAMNRPSVAHGSGSAVDMKDLIAKLMNSSEFRSNLKQLISKSTLAEQITSLDGRMSVVGDAVKGIQQGMDLLLVHVERVESVVSSAEAEAEIAELKGALNHVAMLAKCAHEATVEERKEHRAEITRLQKLLSDRA